MKKLCILALLLAATVAFAGKPESIDSLKARAAEAEGKHQVDLFRKIAEQQTDATVDFYSQGNSQQAQAALADVVDYGVKAAQTAAQTGKHMKKTEISLRKMAERLEDLRRSLSVDDRPVVKAAEDNLQQARTELLNRMFRKK